MEGCWRSFWFKRGEATSWLYLAWVDAPQLSLLYELHSDLKPGWFQHHCSSAQIHLLKHGHLSKHCCQRTAEDKDEYEIEKKFALLQANKKLVVCGFGRWMGGGLLLTYTTSSLNSKRCWFARLVNMRIYYMRIIGFLSFIVCISHFLLSCLFVIMHFKRVNLFLGHSCHVGKSLNLKEIFLWDNWEHGRVTFHIPRATFCNWCFRSLRLCTHHGNQQIWWVFDKTSQLPSLISFFLHTSPTVQFLLLLQHPSVLRMSRGMLLGFSFLLNIQIKLYFGE